MSTAVDDIEDLQRLLTPLFPSVNVDGDIGRITRAAVMEMPDFETRREIQIVLKRKFPNLKVDGVIGPISLSALSALDELGDHESMADEFGSLPGQKGLKASSFADPADVRAFKTCKAQKRSDMACFAVGDNGIGKWGANCAQTDVPMVALPREVWRAAGKTGGSKLILRYNGKVAAAELGDTMPALANIKNGAGIDLNPAACKVLGLTPPVMVKGVTYEWV